jgi:UDP-N-acetylglucosamine--N-acetylmuramyl-(pentapeptide) pyrophosphoryl-undecaprenol N-acetylglucosamine transferase
VSVRIVITGGGTGGHLFPALAVHEALRARRPEADALFVGAARGVEATILPRRGCAFRGLTATPVSGTGWRGRFAAARALPGTIRQAGRFLREFRPQVVFGVGGYASVPTVLAAGLARIPRVIHEQNAAPGLANRALGRIASAVAVSFADTTRCFPVGRTQVTGNPVRAEIRAGDARAARARLDLDPEAFTVLIFGGSQGARRLNQAMQEALPALAAERAGLQFVHATGASDLADVRRAYQASRVSARVEPFFEEMALAYQAADFAICRAGAGTLFELAAMGIPALLVPYPYAANDHQRLNGETAVRAGAAWMLLDQFCDGPRLVASVRAAREKPDQLAEMGRRARTLARPDAADRIVDLLERVALVA